MPKEDKLFKRIMTVFLLSFLLIPVFMLYNIADRLALFPLLNAAGKAAQEWPTYYSEPRRYVDDSGRNGIDLYINANTQRKDDDAEAKAKGDLAFAQQIQGMNDYLITHPDFYLVSDGYAVHIYIGHGDIHLSNVGFLDYGMTSSGRIDCAAIDVYSINMYGGEFIREMRCIYNAVSERKRERYFGLFLSSLDDLSVLDNLERIGPAESFSEEELSWFAENLPNCEVWE